MRCSRVTIDNDASCALTLDHAWVPKDSSSAALPKVMGAHLGNLLRLSSVASAVTGIAIKAAPKKS